MIWIWHPHIWKRVKTIDNYVIHASGIVGRYRQDKCRLCPAMRVRMEGKLNDSGSSM